MLYIGGTTDFAMSVLSGKFALRNGISDMEMVLYLRATASK